MLFYNNDTDYRDEFRGFWNNNVKKFRTSSIVLGVIMLILGILCFIFPVRSMIVMEYIASIFLIIIGIGQIYAESQLPVYLKTGGTLLSGVLNIILGIMLILSPTEVMMSTFAFIIAIDLLLLGIEQCVAYSRAKFFQAEGAGWVLFEGILNIILAIIFMFMPQMSITISYIIAIYLTVIGIVSIYAGVRAGSMKLKD